MVDTTKEGAADDGFGVVEQGTVVTIVFPSVTIVVTVDDCAGGGWAALLPEAELAAEDAAEAALLAILDPGAGGAPVDDCAELLAAADADDPDADDAAAEDPDADDPDADDDAWAELFTALLEAELPPGFDEEVLAH